MLPSRSVLLLMPLLMPLQLAGGAEERWHAIPAPGKPATVGIVRLWPTVPPTRVRVVPDGSDQAVGAQLLWAAPDQPAEVVFDGSAGRPVTVILDGPTGSPLGKEWDPPAGVVLETRTLGSGGLDTWDQFKLLWQASQPVQGRSLVPHVFDGFNRHGPSDNFCDRYQGWLHIEKPGIYTFATISDDASWLFVDDTLICDWPGGHGPDDGLRGKYSGTIQLNPGRHRFLYCHVQGGGGTVSEAAWKPPGVERLAVIPPEAFGLPRRWQAERCEGEANAPAWELVGHSRIDDQVLVTVRVRTVAGGPAAFSVSPAEGGESQAWQGAEGLLTLSPGRWLVRAGGSLRSMLVTPVWTQVDDWDEPRWKAQRSDLLTRREGLPLGLLAAGMRLARVAEDGDLTWRLGEALVTRLGAQKVVLTPGSVGDLGWIALRLQQSDQRHYSESAAVFTAAIAVPGADRAQVDGLRLHFAGLRIHAFGDGAAAEALLSAIAREKLSDGDRRLHALYAADARLALGDVAGCRERLAAIAEVVDQADTGYALRRRLRLERARDLIARGEWDAAEQPLREIEWETPRERLGSETGLLLAKVWLGRHESPLALVRLRFLALAAPDDPHASDVLFALLGAQLAAGDKAGAKATAVRLKADHPASEATARLADIRIPE